MADNTQSTTNAITNSFTKGMLKDPAETFLGEGVWTHARNAVNNSVEGQVGLLGNEQATKFCQFAPYNVIGAIYIIDDEWVIFSTNGIDSEVGRFHELNCTYTKVVNAKCLAFSKMYTVLDYFIIN